ncbi:hypothetical protein FIE12Z_1096 [Fusarium flagelliforme]|uniref:Myb-like domain-containing protein n=2 Tax=Fusarium flagelliforme TaxID=2675880 RepID=A0A395N3A1_9HYPO|nr:hypothetical protein FIE12Z_1096 [Fusarium flagelliforme]
MSRKNAIPNIPELPGDCVTMGPVELEGSPAYGLSTSSGGYDSSEYESSMSGAAPTSTCNKPRTMKCTKACCKGKAKTRCKDLRVKIVTPSQAEFPSSEGAKSADDESTASTWSSNPKNKKRKGKGKGKASRVQSSTENESSGQTDEPSTDLNTATKYSTPVVEDPNWSVSEDYRLRSMKEAGETWRFISTSLRKSQNDVRARWKVLERQAIASDATTEPETDGATTEGESVEAVDIDENTSNNNTSDQVDGSEKTSENGSEVDDSDETSDNDSNSDEEDDTDEDAGSIVKPKGKVGNTFTRNKWHKGVRNRKVANENKWAKARAKAKTEEESDSPIETGKGTSDNASETSSYLEYGDPEKTQQMRYLQDHVYKEMYPAEIHPQPDAYLNQRDCDLLATIDSKYKRSRWLEMQANFYNVTGRMVPLEAIRDRCERAEAEEEDRSAARKLERRIERVETWIDGQARGNSDE